MQAHICVLCKKPRAHACTHHAHAAHLHTSTCMGTQGRTHICTIPSWTRKSRRCSFRTLPWFVDCKRSLARPCWPGAAPADRNSNATLAHSTEHAPIHLSATSQCTTPPYAALECRGHTSARLNIVMADDGVPEPVRMELLEQRHICGKEPGDQKLCEIQQMCKTL